jgi:hypothetical protein
MFERKLKTYHPQNNVKKTSLIFLLALKNKSGKNGKPVFTIVEKSLQLSLKSALQDFYKFPTKRD